jgi:predicted dinucleotide-binding enzyme
MKIGILGAGSIGSTLAHKLAAAGHEVKVANSRGPETIAADALTTGAAAVKAADVVQDVEVLITSIPLRGMPGIKPLIADLSRDAIIIDTSNYYPARDGHVQALEEGQVESLWVTEQLGRPVVKAWNAITSGTFEAKGAPAGDPNRLAIPVAADDDSSRETAMTLVEETGFDALDAGSLADSWRQQPGAPAYCTELTLEEMPAALAAADKDVLPGRRDKAMAVIGKRMEAGDSLTVADLVAINRAIYA